MATEGTRDSLHTKLKKTHSWVTLVGGTILAVVLFGFQAAQFLDTLATRQQLGTTRDYMVAENVKIKTDLEYALRHTAELQVELTTIHKSFVDHMEKHSGRLAAEREPDRRKAAQSAERARKKFREAINAGRTIEQALYDSSPDYL